MDVKSSTVRGAQAEVRLVVSSTGDESFPPRNSMRRRLLVEERQGPDRLWYRTPFAESRSLLLLPGETHGLSKLWRVR